MKRILKHIFVWMILATFVNNIIAPSTAFADTIGVATADELRARFATNTGGDVRLDEDITLSGNYAMRAPMNLDLNGHVLTIANGKCLFAYSDITVLDSQNSERSAIVGSFDNNYILRIGSASIPGSITLESGKIVSTSANGRGILITNGSITVNNGLIESSGYAINNSDEDGEITINNGEVRATTTFAGIYSNVNGAKLNINGGKVSAPSFAVYQAGTFIMNNGVIESNGLSFRSNANSTFEMNGGRIETFSNDNVAITLQDGTTATINNGEIFAKNGIDENKGSNSIAIFKNTDLTINNVVIEAWGNAILGNGSGPESGSTDGTNAKVTINGGKILSTGGDALYMPQINGVTTINGGELTGASGVEIRAGQLIVKGGKITGTEAYRVIYNTNGGTTYGAAIAVAQHTSKKPIDVVITGGTMSAEKPISFTNPLDLDQEIVDQVSIKVGGGYFSSSVADFIENGFYEVWVNHDDKKMIYVTNKHNVNAANNSHINITKNDALLNDEVEISTDVPEGYILKIEVKDSDGNVIEVVDNKFIMPDTDVIIMTSLEKIPEEPVAPTEPEEKSENEEVPEVPDTGAALMNNSMVTTSAIIGAIFGGLVGLYASRKKIKALFE